MRFTRFASAESFAADEEDFTCFSYGGVCAGIAAGQSEKGFWGVEAVRGVVFKTVGVGGWGGGRGVLRGARWKHVNQC